MKEARGNLTIAGKRVSMTRSQCEVIFALAEHPGAAMSMDSLVWSVYGRRLASAFLGCDDWANVRALIYRVNRDCRSAGLGDVIENVFNYGYRWAEGTPIPKECGSSQIEVCDRSNMKLNFISAPNTGARA